MLLFVEFFIEFFVLLFVEFFDVFFVLFVDLFLAIDYTFLSKLECACQQKRYEEKTVKFFEINRN